MSRLTQVVSSLTSNPGRYCIAHILRTPGDVMGYHYDFGDNWFVDIKARSRDPVRTQTCVSRFPAARRNRVQG